MLKRKLSSIRSKVQWKSIKKRLKKHPHRSPRRTHLPRERLQWLQLQKLEHPSSRRASQTNFTKSQRILGQSLDPKLAVVSSARDPRLRSQQRCNHLWIPQLLKALFRRKSRRALWVNSVTISSGSSKSKPNQQPSRDLQWLQTQLETPTPWLHRKLRTASVLLWVRADLAISKAVVAAWPLVVQAYQQRDLSSPVSDTNPAPEEPPSLANLL